MLLNAEVGKRKPTNREKNVTDELDQITQKLATLKTHLSKSLKTSNNVKMKGSDSLDINDGIHKLLYPAAEPALKDDSKILFLDNAKLKLTPEIQHDLLLRKEARFGRQIKSYEFGHQDLIFPNKEYLVMQQTPTQHTFDVCSLTFNKTSGENEKKIQYWQHPLYELLEKNVDENPIHSNWLSLIQI